MYISKCNGAPYRYYYVNIKPMSMCYQFSQPLVIIFQRTLFLSPNILERNSFLIAIRNRRDRRTSAYHPVSWQWREFKERSSLYRSSATVSGGPISRHTDPSRAREGLRNFESQSRILCRFYARSHDVKCVRRRVNFGEISMARDRACLCSIHGCTFFL